MASRAPLLLASLALAVPAPALAADSSGGTGIPVDGSGGVRSIPGDPAAPEPAGPVAPATPAAKADSRPATAAAPPVSSPVARSGQSGGDDGDVVKVPVPRAEAPAARRPAAVTPASLPRTGFDLGVFVAVGMGILGAGLLLSAIVGPRPARSPRPSA